MEKKILEQCYRERLPIPDKIANAPDLYLGLDLYYSAFLDLSTCRSRGFGELGEIPWTATLRWAEVHELDEEQRDSLFHHIRAMDDVYLKFQAKKAKEASNG